ncbi:MAG: exonuclease domain-containing protein [Bacillota bacterium]
MPQHLIRMFRGFTVKLSGIRESGFLPVLVRELNRRRDADVLLADQVYTAFDLETTGLYPFAGDRIISLGAAMLEAGRISASYEQFVNPGRPLSRFITELTGINDSDVAEAPAVEEVLPAFIAFLTKGIPVGFNVDFDLSFLNLVLRFAAGVKINRSAAIDVLAVVRALNPTWQHCLLDDAAAFYGVPVDGRHSARGDAVIHARLFWRLVPVLAGRGIYTLKDLRGYLQYRGLL